MCVAIQRHEDVEACYQFMDSLIEGYRKKYGKPYLDSLIESLEDEAIQLIDAYSRTTLRHAFQLVMMKGMRTDNISIQGVTPDSIVQIYGYLVKELLDKPKLILELATGTGQLLTGILNVYIAENKDFETTGFGVEENPLLIRLAYINSLLQRHPIELYKQDALKPIHIEPADLTLSDLPTGLYMNEGVISSYQLYSAGEEHLYHHLLIEQSLRYTNIGGYVMLMIPDSLYKEPRSEKLLRLIKEHSHILALLKMPSSFFYKEEVQKSMMILKRRGKDDDLKREVLVTELPNMKNKERIKTILSQIVAHLRRYK
jgi:site-specific DNA-methyltransferase (adenine-specific)